MTLNSFFNRIYCINLPSRTDRRKHCERVFKKLEWDVHMFSASPGKVTGGSATVEANHAAIKLAHITLVSEALLDGLKNVLLFDDDILVAKDAVRHIESFLDVLPSDWELCYLGWMDWLDHKTHPHSITVQGVTEMNGVHAVGINRSIMFDYLKAQAMMDCHCDTALARYIQPNGKAYAPTRNLITQGCFGSDMTWKPQILPAERLGEFV